MSAIPNSRERTSPTINFFFFPYCFFFFFTSPKPRPLGPGISFCVSAIPGNWNSFHFVFNWSTVPVLPKPPKGCIHLKFIDFYCTAINTTHFFFFCIKEFKVCTPEEQPLYSGGKKKTKTQINLCIGQALYKDRWRSTFRSTVQHNQSTADREWITWHNMLYYLYDTTCHTQYKIDKPVYGLKWTKCPRGLVWC